MHKEPNDVLVMTTCKCRENTTNLVMTRTWFQEQLASKIAIGVEQEQKRIIELLEGQIKDSDLPVDKCIPHYHPIIGRCCCKLIALIKELNND